MNSSHKRDLPYLQLYTSCTVKMFVPLLTLYISVLPILISMYTSLQMNAWMNKRKNKIYIIWRKNILENPSHMPNKHNFKPGLYWIFSVEASECQNFLWTRFAGSGTLLTSGFQVSFLNIEYLNDAMYGITWHHLTLLCSSF